MEKLPIVSLCRKRGKMVLRGTMDEANSLWAVVCLTRQIRECPAETKFTRKGAFLQSELGPEHSLREKATERRSQEVPIDGSDYTPFFDAENFSPGPMDYQWTIGKHTCRRWTMRTFATVDNFVGAKEEA